MVDKAPDIKFRERLANVVVVVTLAVQGGDCGAGLPGAQEHLLDIARQHRVRADLEEDAVTSFDQAFDGRRESTG